MRLRDLSLATMLLAPTLGFAQQDFSHCSLPGELVSEDAATDVVPAPGTGFDLKSVYVAELATDDGKDKIYFSMQIDRQAAAATPQSRYIFEFTTPDGVARYLSYTPYPIAPIGSVFAGEDQMFVIGHYVDTSVGRGASNDGPADAASSATPDGLITIVAEKKKLGKLKPGDVIADITASTRIYNLTGTFPLDDSDELGIYTVHGNDSCKSKKSAEAKDLAVEDKSATSFGGAFAPGLLLMLLGAAVRRFRRHTA